MIEKKYWQEMVISIQITQFLILHCNGYPALFFRLATG